MRSVHWQALLMRAGLAPLLALALGGCAAGTLSGQTQAQETTSAQMSTVTPQDATPMPTTPIAFGPTCRPDQLTLAIKFLGAAMGNVGEQDHFTNHSTSACSLYGFPGAQLLDAQRNQMATHTHLQTSAYLYPTQPMLRVEMAPGASAYFIVEWTDVPTGSATSCPMSSYLSVTPPNASSVLTIAAQIGACGGDLYLSPVEPTPIMGG